MTHDLLGRRFGKLTATKRLGSKRKRILWLCRCDCGGSAEVLSSRLLNGAVTSCGCAWKSRPHGHTVGYKKSPTNSSWNAMIARCTSPGNAGFEHYRKRGITVCDRWRYGEDALTGFQCFLEDMGERPSKAHTIERKNNDGNYEPSNCRWATRREQANNRVTNSHIEYDGKRLSFAEAGRLFGLPRWTIRDRLRKGWDLERAIRTPLRPMRGRPPLD